MNSKALRGIGLVAFALALVLAAPNGAVAQDRVYDATEVSVPPRIKSESAVVNAINRSYPASLQSVGGRVQLRFVVRENGRVDASSIEVVVSSSTALGQAAVQAVRGIEFQPAQVDGAPVSSIVLFPITYAAR